MEVSKKDVLHAKLKALLKDYYDRGEIDKDVITVYERNTL